MNDKLILFAFISGCLVNNKHFNTLTYLQDKEEYKFKVYGDKLVFGISHNLSPHLGLISCNYNLDNSFCNVNGGFMEIGVFGNETTEYKNSYYAKTEGSQVSVRNNENGKSYNFIISSK